MEKKNIMIIGSVLIVILTGISMIIMGNKVDLKQTDAEKFSEEYPGVDSDNVFVYRNINEIIKILEKGTGIVYIGFPECPWCQSYVVHLNDVAKDMGVEKIYYLNIMKDRKNNTKEYKKLVSILSDYLDNDEEGNKKVFVPDVTFVVKGKIVGHDNETSQITSEEETPKKYWDKDKVKFLKTRLSGLIHEVNGNSCTSCN